MHPKKPSKEKAFSTKYAQLLLSPFYSKREIISNTFARNRSKVCGMELIYISFPCWWISLFSSPDCLKMYWQCKRKLDIEKNSLILLPTSAPLKTELIPWIELTLSGKSSARICLHKALYTWITLSASSSPVPLSHDAPCVCSTLSSWFATKVSDAGSTPPCLEKKIKIELK